MASFSSNIFSYMLQQKLKDKILFFIGLLLSVVVFFGGGIFIARLFVPGGAGIFLGILLGIGVIFTIAFMASYSYLEKLKKIT